MSIDSLRIVLGDQLTPSLSALWDGDKARDVVLMTEVAEETSYVRHHKNKIAFVLGAMRAFARELRESGLRVDYVKIDDPHNQGSFTRELGRAIARHKPVQIITTQASEHRVAAMQAAWRQLFDTPVEIREDDRFVCSPSEFAAWAEGRKQLRMEYFYREMRRKTVVSDSAALHRVVASLLDALAGDVHVLRDPTRGGVASAANEIAASSRVSLHFNETAIPVREAVRGACEILGLDPLYVANEGKFLAIVARDRADEAIETVRRHPVAAAAAVVGEVAAGPAGRVGLRSRIGGERIVDMIAGEPLPRIC